MLIVLLSQIFLINSFADEIDWDKLVESVIQVESSSNPNAYNEKSGAIGLMQITPIVLKEYNKTPKKYYYSVVKELIRFNDDRTHDILYRSGWPMIVSHNLYYHDINKHIGTWYLHRLENHYKCSTIEQILGSYNWGIGNVRKVKYDYDRFPKSVKRYIRKVLKLYER